MKLFFDTEFTGLHKDTTLISIGIVSEDGRKFYAEFMDYDSEQVTDWIKENVLDHCIFFYPPKEVPCIDFESRSIMEFGGKEEVATILKQWLAQFDTVEFVSDVCHYDFVLLIDLFGGAFDLPKNVCPACHDINQDIARHYGISETEAFDKSREEIVLELCGEEIKGRKHNALYDAEVIRAIYREVTP